ncbi:MAG: dihydropyrimidinase [Candidatus Marinimicrobia bacterium]|nr:dihydropyrimidinase [Candidatus Neomarinimicrobiota bacterium]MBL7067679.1 dihydropyrimidinase [Candidatus Neomarinimicrobiota bacterium]
MIIKNGNIVTAEKIFKGDIEIRDEKIIRIGPELDTKDVQVIDVDGSLILPGIIDSHVHFEEIFSGGLKNADDFESGTRAAAAGGVTTVIDFTSPQARNESLVKAFQRRRRQADPKVFVDYSLHCCFPGGVTSELLSEMGKIKDIGAPSFKIFTAGEDLGLNRGEVFAVMQQAAKLGVMVDVHAEEGDIINFLEKRLLKADKKSLSFFPQSRPNFIEETVVHDLIRFNAYLKGKLYFVHLSAGESVDVLDLTRDLHGEVFGETCPQYLLLTDSCYEFDNGEQYAIVPPLRHAEDQKRLWQAIKEGVIQVVGTDHCPFMSQYKQGKSDFTQVPKGMGSVELLLPLMFSEGVVKKRISVNQLVQVLSTNPAKIFGMFPRKGTIALNSDADLVIFNPGEKWQVSTDKLVSRADFSPYDLFELTGKVEMTISRGEVVYRDGKILGKAGRGQFIFRRL